MTRPKPSRVWVLSTLIALLAAHLYFLNVWPRFSNPNVLSRAFMTMAIVDHGSLQIDPYVAHTPIGDMAEHEGHYYSDKAPGFAVLLVPVAWVLRHSFVPAPEWKEMVVGLRMLGLGLPMALLWFASRRYYAELAGDVRTALAVVLAGALGTNAFVYGTHLFSHAPAACLLFGCFLCLRRLPEPSAPGWLAPLAGLLLATAFVTDFIVIVCAAVLGLHALWVLRHRPRQAAAFCLACAVPLGLWLWMNAECYGSPFTVGFHLSTDNRFKQGYSSGLAGIQPPDPASLWGMAFGRRRGMVFLSPFLALAPLGFVLLWRRGARRDVGLSLAIIIGLVAFSSTTLDWGGGWGAGVRYLVPAVPFLLVGVAGVLGEVRYRAWSVPLFQGLALASVLLLSVVVATFPYYPELYRDPVYQLSVPMVQHGIVTRSVASLLGAGTSLVPWGGFVGLACTLLLVLVPAPARVRLLNASLSLVLAAIVVATQWASAIEPSPPEQYWGRAIVEFMGYGPPG